MTQELNKLLKESHEKYLNMTPGEKEEMLQKQRESFVRGEVGWPKPRYHYEDGVKVYESYEDYCNG